MTQQNNFLYRVIITDSITPEMFAGSYNQANMFAINYVTQARWKFYDFGRSVASALSVASATDNAIDKPSSVESPS